MRFEGKVAVITGAAKGIGRACAERFARDGARVIVADVDSDAGEATAADIGDDARFIYCDVAERLDVRNMLAETIEHFGKVDILVNNAGIVHGADFLDIDEADFDRVLRTNLKGMFLTSQIIVRHMVERVKDGEAPGVVVNMSSVNAVFAIANQVPYSISKGGVMQLTKVMALSLAAYGIRVNAVGPGSIMTDMLQAVADDAEARRKVLSRTPLGRIGDPSEIASVVAFLASDDASYVTGQTVYPDGGRLPLNYTVVPPED